MDKLLNLIGLAKKAGKLEVGEEPVGAAARSKHARLIRGFDHDQGGIGANQRHQVLQLVHATASIKARSR